MLLKSIFFNDFSRFHYTTTFTEKIRQMARNLLETTGIGFTRFNVFVANDMTPFTTF